MRLHGAQRLTAYSTRPLYLLADVLVTPEALKMLLVAIEQCRWFFSIVHSPAQLPRNILDTSLFSARSFNSNSLYLANNCLSYIKDICKLD